MFKVNVIVLLIIVLFSCSSKNKKKSIESKKDSFVFTKPFNADTTYYFLKKQVEFGYRIPNTQGHKNCKNFLYSTLTKYLDTIIEQDFSVKVFNGKTLNLTNIIGIKNKNAKERILLMAHWDTRPWADRQKKDFKKPIDGANDGASGVAVLLEIARLIKNTDLDIGVDIILFDGEDYGQPFFDKNPKRENSYCLGSQYWARNKHLKNYNANFGILLDMVGGKNAIFRKEKISYYFASNVVNKVWEIAHSLNYQNRFESLMGSSVMDDHYYINKITRIPSINIIEYNPNTEFNFYEHWHTTKDNIKNIDKKTLKDVGNVVINTIFYFNKKKTINE